MPLVCERCGHDTRSVFQQEDPEVKGQLWCGVCHRDKKFSGRFDTATHMVRDEYSSPITLENYGANPVTFNSESERVAYMHKHELHLKERWCPFPGTDKDPAGVQNPDGYVDGITMKNRVELFLRANNSKKDEDISGLVVGSFSGTISHKDAVAVANGTDPARASRLHRRTSERTDAK